MQRRILKPSSATDHRRLAGTPQPRFVRRLATSSARERTAGMLPLGTLWDPTLLSRLQAPLTRLRE